MLQVLFAVENSFRVIRKKRKKHRKKQKAGKEQWKSLSKFDWLKGLKQRAGKFSIKSSSMRHLWLKEPKRTRPKWIKTAQDKEEVDRWIKTQDCKTKKWIDGSRLKKARPKKQSLYRCPGWGHRRSLQVTMDHNTTTTGQSFHVCVTIIYV